MYISWIHDYVPKLFGGLAFLVNPIFVYLIFSKKSAKLGNYKYLLLYFATFNVIYSSFDIFVPIGIHNYRYGFFIFTSDGYFFPRSQLGVFMLSTRCSLISCSYAVLITHFIYRYLAIRRCSIVQHHFKLYMTLSFILFLVYYTVWNLVCYKFGYADSESREYVRKNFRETYDIDSMDLNILVTTFDEVSAESVFRARTAILAVTFISGSSIIFLITMGFKIMRRLNEASLQMSEKTSRLQRDLLRALTVQCVIPICVSFVPCALSWYSPVFNVNLGRGFNYIESIALSAFPLFDPIAIVLCLPVLREQMFRERLRKKENVEISNVSSALRVLDPQSQSTS